MLVHWYKPGENMTSIEPNSGAINDICVFNESGLMLLALDSSQIPAYFVPALGPAPKWCSYLENLTAKALVDPFAYDEYREKQKKEKIEAKQASRITDYEVDELSQEFLSLHPQSSKKQPSLIEEHFEPVREDWEEQGTSDSDASIASQDSEDELDTDGNKVKKSKGMRLYEVKDERHAEAFLRSVSLAKEDALPLGERVAALEKQQSVGTLNDVKFGPGGSRQISFTSKSSKRQKVEQPEEGQRRGIHSLGLKPSKSEFYAMGKQGGRGRRGQGRGRGRGRR
ncbi:hypothetical protein BHM03_00052007 [Ensete ventricosum]|nr:hypothetical protein BHM03_00052007 [Ensete ventricosum]